MVENLLYQVILSVDVDSSAYMASFVLIGVPTIDYEKFNLTIRIAPI